MENNKLVDLDYFKKTTGFNDKDVVGFIDIFLDHSPEEIDALELHCKEKDCEKIRGIAHKLKPRITYLGIDALYDPMDRLHSCAKEGKNMEEFSGIFEEIKEVFIKVVEELKNSKANLTS
ncbi:MAG: Hpt domain-containing protein [Bacteroidia bacterium]|nr:Hpt domain-containing protein [Bacteroidia bacterium]